MDLGRAVGLSAEMARRYEKWGYLPPAERSATGRRRYGRRHLHAILAAREMRAGFGSQVALGALQRLHAGDMAGALALVDGQHAALHRQRLDVEETLRTLQRLAEAGPLTDKVEKRVRSARSRVLSADGQAPIPIGEAARRAGVRLSAVRFWEEQGLLQPVRDPSSGYRLFDAHQLLRLQIVATLRRAHYTFDGIAAALVELGQGRPSSALSAVERRRRDLARASERCSRATAAFWSYAAEVFDRPALLTEHLEKQPPHPEAPSYPGRGG